MNPVIQHHVLPLVGKVKFPGFNKNSFGSMLSLQTKIVNHISIKNSEKLKEYLAFCIQTWPNLSTCPLDIRIINKAVEVIKEVKYPHIKS